MDTETLLIILSLSSIVSGICITALRNCSKSKCSEVSFMWDCVSIKRDTEAEEKQHEFDVRHDVSTSEASPNTSRVSSIFYTKV